MDVAACTAYGTTRLLVRYFLLIAALTAMWPEQARLLPRLHYLVTANTDAFPVLAIEVTAAALAKRDRARRPTWC